MLPDGAVDIFQRQLRESLAQVRSELREVVVAAVERISEKRVLGLRQNVGVFDQELPRGIERLTRHPLARQLIVFVERRAQGEDGVLRLDRTNPDLEDLLLAPEIRVGRELKHPAREIFDVCVVAVVQAALFAQLLVKIIVARPVLAEIRGDERQRRPVLVAALDADRKPERDGRRTSLALNSLDPRARREFRRGDWRLITLPLRQPGEIGYDLFVKLRRVTACQAYDQIGRGVMPAI